MDQEVENLLALGVIQRTEHEEDEVIPPVFLVQKSDGSYRTTFNLKLFNEDAEYRRFKMEKWRDVGTFVKNLLYLDPPKHGCNEKRINIGYMKWNRSTDNEVIDLCVKPRILFPAYTLSHISLSS